MSTIIRCIFLIKIHSVCGWTYTCTSLWRFEGRTEGETGRKREAQRIKPSHYVTTGESYCEHLQDTYSHWALVCLLTWVMTFQKCRFQWQRSLNRTRLLASLKLRSHVRISFGSWICAHAFCVMIYWRTVYREILISRGDPARTRLYEAW
jgi:hypothetical protein